VESEQWWSEHCGTASAHMVLATRVAALLVAAKSSGITSAAASQGSENCKRRHRERRHRDRWHLDNGLDVHRDRWHLDNGLDVPLEAHSLTKAHSLTPRVALTGLIEYHCRQHAVKHTLVSSCCGPCEAGALRFKVTWA
jgi:hypothetical protein